MNIEKRQQFIQREIEVIAQFLNSYKELWSQEVLNTYPLTRSSFKEEWIETLNKLNESDELALENGESFDHWEDSSLKELFNSLSSLEKIPALPSSDSKKYPSWAFQKVSGKKQHEIKRIVSLLPKLGLEAGDHFIDIGGGKGHLARILSYYHGLNGQSLDSNEEFQKLGLARLQKYPAPESAGDMKFTLHTFGADQKREREIFAPVKGSFGLHTCGPLALHHLTKARRDHTILNFGCCYNKLIPQETATSLYVKENKPYLFTKHALSLATRGHTTISLKDYQIKKIVKYRRAALHFYLLEKGLQDEFTSVGSAHPRDYKKSFAHYALLKLEQLGKEANELELENFYANPLLQEKIHFIYQANMIRWRFGRILEKLIILDRTLALLEQGFDAYYFEIFKAELSPRNIGIIVNPARSLDQYFFD